MNSKHLLLALSLLAGFAASARATTLGLDSAPLGSNVSSSVGYAHWETFTGINFTNDAADNVDADVFTATLSSSMTGGSAAGGGERLYSGSGPTPNAFNLTLGVTAVQDFDSLSIQLKFTAPSSGTPDAFFTVTPSLPGATATPEFVFYSDEGAQTKFYIYKWVFTNLDVSALDTFTVGITSSANHVSVDGIRVDAAAIPEPSTYAALAGAGVLALALLRRRRAA